jgi:hypothetical protein
MQILNEYSEKLRIKNEELRYAFLINDYTKVKDV